MDNWANSNSSVLQGSDLNLTYLYQLSSSRYLVSVGCTVLWWDWMLTFSDEVRHIWKSPSSIVKWTFFATRYVNLITQPIMLAHVIGLLTVYSPSLCVTVVYSYGLMVYASSISVQFLVGYRTWVIWGRGYSMAALLITIFSIVTIIAFVVTIRATISVGGIRNSVISQNGFCVSTISPKIWPLFLISLMLELFYFSITIAGLWRHTRGTRLLHRHGSIYRKVLFAALYFFSFITVIYVFNAIIWARYGTTPLGWLNTTDMSWIYVDSTFKDHPTPNVLPPGFPIWFLLPTIMIRGPAIDEESMGV